MPAIIKNRVRRSGDTMTGDLNIGLNRLLMTDGANGNILKGNPTGNHLFVRNATDADFGFLYSNGSHNFGNITMGAGNTVDGVDVSAIDQQITKILTGTYTGDGNDNRSINIGIDLTAKNNVYVIIKSDALFQGAHRIEYAQGDATMRYSQSADGADEIQAFNATGFQIGTDDKVNKNGTTYRYIVFYEEP